MQDIDKKCTTANTEGLEQRGYNKHWKLYCFQQGIKKYKNTHNTVQKNWLHNAPRLSSNTTDRSHLEVDPPIRTETLSQLQRIAKVRSTETSTCSIRSSLQAYPPTPQPDLSKTPKTNVFSVKVSSRIIAHRQLFWSVFMMNLIYFLAHSNSLHKPTVG